MWNYNDPFEDCIDVSGLVAFYWNKVDAWFEEDDEVFFNPKDPYKRVDYLQSSRKVRVELNGETLAETDRRRETQERYNQENGITPTTIVKRISNIRDSIWEKDYVSVPNRDEVEPRIPTHEIPVLIESLRREMREAARDLEFERAAALRDRLQELEAERLRVS